MKQKILIVVLVVFLFITTISSIFFIFVSPSAVHMIQYAGDFLFDETWSSGLTKAENVKIGEILIKTDITNFACTYSNWFCSTNTCDGKYEYTDLDGCDRWKQDLCYMEVPSDPRIYQNAYCKYTTGTVCGKNAITTISGSNNCGKILAIDTCGKKATFCSSFTCQSTSTYTYNIPVNCKYECGGITRTTQSCSRGCWGNYSVFFGDELIWTTKDWTKNTNILNDINFGVGSIKSQFNYGNKYVYDDCKRIENTYRFDIPPETVDISVSTLYEELIVNSTKYLFVEITNSLKNNIVANIIVTNNIVIGDNTLNQTTELYKNLSLGKNEVAIKIPTEAETDYMHIKINVDILIKGKYFEGLNGNCYRQTSNKIVDLNTCNYILLGNTDAATSKFKIKNKDTISVISNDTEQKVDMIEKPNPNVDIIYFQKPMANAEDNEISHTNSKESGVLNFFKRIIKYIKNVFAMIKEYFLIK